MSMGEVVVNTDTGGGISSRAMLATTVDPITDPNMLNLNMPDSVDHPMQITPTSFTKIPGTEGPGALTPTIFTPSLPTVDVRGVAPVDWRARLPLMRHPP